MAWRQQRKSRVLGGRAGGPSIAPEVAEAVIPSSPFGSRSSSRNAQEPEKRRSRRPQLPSLLVCRDPAAIRSIRAVAQREAIPLDVCEGAEQALELIAGKSYRSLLVDLDLGGSGHLLRALRLRTEKPVTVAMVGSGAFLGAAFDVGAVLAIHKPVAIESVRLGLKAAYSVGERQGRRAVRRSAQFPCRLGVPGSRLFPGAVLNVGEGGACVSAERCMTPGTFVTVRFALPGAHPVFDVGAVAVWNDGERSTGLRFQRLHYRHAGRIRHWVLGPGGPSATRAAQS